MTDVRYLVANRRLLISIRHSERGLLIEPVHTNSADPDKERCIPHASTLYDICEDDKHCIHIVYIDQAGRLIHAIVRPDHTQILSDMLPLAADWESTTIHTVKLCCLGNALHLFLLRDRGFIHYELTGIHWSSPTTIANDRGCHHIHLVQSAERWMIIGIMNNRQTYELDIWHYNGHSFTWNKPYPAPLVTSWSVEDILHIEAQLDREGLLVLLCLRFLKGKLNFQQFRLAEDDTLIPLSDSTLITPIRQVDAALCHRYDDHIQFTWTAEGHLYRIKYKTSDGSWGVLQSIPASQPTLWYVISNHIDSSMPYTCWLSAHREWLPSDVQLHSFLDLYRTNTDILASVTYAESSLTTVKRLLGTHDKLQEEMNQLEQRIQFCKHQATLKQHRLAALSEELDIRESLLRIPVPELDFPFNIELDMDTNSDRVFLHGHTAVQMSPHISASISDAKQLIQPDHELSSVQKSGVRHKVIHLLQRITKLNQ
ncbi:hypothetical protein MH117_23445 [Paenibacillus sp. ACRRX]|uniref:hypothetical protein n=1 Tax=Paenibacillus sp. ACRRX TaxID=2918206 RepID=UPI001EF6471F|nr:hypothetical protein [Paenibacillus sp. ACRRX]MCG7410371.1 hypothetical protein [Paenibacillus sp. ACRRX]